MSESDPTLSVDERIAELFSGPPTEFIGRRDGLGKKLRSAGDKAAADRVKALRRPTTAAWAVNQLAYRHADDLAQLLELAERLRSAQDDLLAGQGAASLREAASARRDLIHFLADRAVAALGASGGAQREAITHTLEAAAADPEDAAAVASGRLIKELPAPAGFGGLSTFVPKDQPAAGPTQSAHLTDDRRSKNGDGDAEQVAEEQARAEGASLAQTARLERLAATAEDKAGRARDAAAETASADDELRRLRTLLTAAEDTAEKARERAEQTKAAADEAEAEVRAAQAGRPES